MMGRQKRPRCVENEPDCFNCPYPECIATMDDINRQEAIRSKKEKQAIVKARNAAIIEAFKCGATTKELCKMFNLSAGVICEIVRPYRVSYRSLRINGLL